MAVSGQMKGLNLMENEIEGIKSSREIYIFRLFPTSNDNYCSLQYFLLGTRNGSVAR